MKTHAPSSSRWLPLAKTGMAIAALCVAGHVHAQATPTPPADGNNGADKLQPAKAPGGAKRPHQHREVSRGPVKPKHYPSNPLPPVPQRP